MMMNDVERAGSPRGLVSFPKRWLKRGGLTTSMTDAEMSGWVRANIEEDRALGIPPGTRRDENRHIPDGMGGFEFIPAVPVGPASIATQNRRRKLELLRHGPYGPRGH